MIQELLKNALFLSRQVDKQFNYTKKTGRTCDYHTTLRYVIYVDTLNLT